MEPVVTSAGLAVQVDEQEDGSLEISLSWPPGSPWDFLSEISNEEAVAMVVGELVKKAYTEAEELPSFTESDEG